MNPASAWSNSCPSLKKKRIELWNTPLFIPIIINTDELHLIYLIELEWWRRNMGKGKSGLDSWNQNYGCELPYACLPCPKEKKEFYSYWTIYKSAIQQLSPALLTRRGSYWFETENALTANLRLLDFMSIQFFYTKTMSHSNTKWICCRPAVRMSHVEL
jgi:hypothetical protein